MIYIPNIFYYFGLGVLFVEAIPLLEAIIAFFIQFVTMLQGFVAVIVTAQSAKIASIKKEAYSEDSASPRIIGFDISNENYDDEEVEEEN